MFDFVDVEVARPDGRTALHDLTLEIPQGGVTTVVGPSGAGKTTLLRLCNRLEVPTSGAVRYRGTDLDALPVLEHRRRVGMVFQQPTPLPGTVRDNLVVAVGRDVGDGRDLDAGDPSALVEMLERVGLDETFLGRRAQELSGGEAQRVCLARALLTRPEVLLLDEPTSALDPDSRVVIEQLGRRLAADGVAVVWVTHDLGQAARLGGRSVVLVGGSLATPDQSDEYLNRGDGGATDGPGGRHGE